MTLDELIYIKKVCEEENILKASKKLYISQPALSYCIKKVEKKLGTKLFIRKRDGLELTNAGKEYYEVAAKIISLYKDFENNISSLNDKTKINFGITDFLSKHYVHLIFGIMSSKFPNIQLNLVEDNSKNLGDMLLKGELDMVLMHKSSSDHFEEYDIETIYKDFFVIVTQKGTYTGNDYIEYQGDRINVIEAKEFEDKNFIFLKKNKKIQEINNTLFQKWDFNPKSHITLEGFETAINMASSGNGVFIVPYQYLKVITDIKNIDLFILDPDIIYSWETCLILNPKKSNELNPLKQEIERIYKQSTFKL